MKSTFSIIGNLTKDPELKSTGSGMAVASLSVACNHRVKKDGEWQQEASFFDVTLFDKKAETAAKYLTKGARVGLDGYMRQQHWEDRDGNKRHKIALTGTELYFLSSKREATEEADTGSDDGSFDPNEPFPF